MTINSHISGYSPVQLQKIVKLVINWCRMNIGENRRTKKNLYVRLDFDDDAEDFADFDVEKRGRIITLYICRNKTIKDLISSCIHEYTHALQFWTKYWKLYGQYGYKRHPYEIEAREISEDNYLQCWNEISIAAKRAIKN